MQIEFSAICRLNLESGFLTYSFRFKNKFPCNQTAISHSYQSIGKMFFYERAYWARLWECLIHKTLYQHSHCTYLVRVKKTHLCDEVLLVLFSLKAAASFNTLHKNIKISCFFKESKQLVESIKQLKHR